MTLTPLSKDLKKKCKELPKMNVVMAQILNSTEEKDTINNSKYGEKIG
jgi:hypothetical protein